MITTWLAACDWCPSLGMFYMPMPRVPSVRATIFCEDENGEVVAAAAELHAREHGHSVYVVHVTQTVVG